MTFGGISTGKTLNLTPLGCSPANAEPCLLFDPDSTTNVSHVFEVSEAKIIRAFDLAQGEVLSVEMVAGAGSGHMFEPMILNGSVLRITGPNNVLLIPIPGRYRLRFHGVIGEVTAFCEDVPCCAAQVMYASGLFSPDKGVL